ncbi:hypothetical protein SY83_16855 [Paenibacillus swuensis]|uniref:histidine kinase n=1 Tax=Paenibacillus swuensis TaxID=1178515 RepID=A0A172TKU3_9BACL|nr:sensor histidine kinase [Paenibacillus swuensis]ANE47675.1 hypothetical protein SY83_16855 [Paenibacillus swuensis]
MLLEKLFLSILIVLAPVLAYTAFSERWRHAQKPYVIGLLHGTASSLCLLCSFYASGLYWDLRYVPMIISTIYGGPVAGFINYLMIMGTRTYLGGDALLFGFVSITLTFIGPILFARKAKHWSGPARIKAAVLISCYPNMIMLLILISYSLTRSSSAESTFNVYTGAVLFGMMQIFGTWLASMLLEFTYERTKMISDIQRAEKLKTMGELAASIAHEVRNPLTVVQGFLQLMRPHQTGKNQQYLHIALTELARAETIISDYLSFSKTKLTRLEVFEITNLLHNVVLLLSPLATKHNVTMKYNEDGPMYLYTDRGQLQQALVNIIKNAIEATNAMKHGEVSVYSTIIEGTPPMAQIMIKDNGRGMTPEQLTRIGTLFFSMKDVGTGLGTAVAIRIIEEMNGRITYTSEPGAGTMVMLLLPLHTKN